MREIRWTRIVCLALAVFLLTAGVASASHISGIRITQTGNTGLMLNVDVTAFYTTGSTETTAYLGTYYNQVPALDWGDGSTVPRYGLGTSTGIPLVATSTVVNGIPARAYRGSFSHTYGSAGSYTISAQTACCPLTTPTYTLVSGSIVTTTFTTSTPFSTMATVTTSFVQNTLGVTIAAPGFSKAFAPNSVSAGVPSTLTFTIDNSGSTLDDNALDFTDNMPAGLVVASPANVVNTCTGGTLTAAVGTSVISYTGGTVAAGASCTIAVDVQSAGGGIFVNTSGDLTSAFGNSGPANDMLTVFLAPNFTKTFAPATVGVSSVSTLTFVVDNSGNSVPATGLGFTDSFPAGLVVATPSNAATTCTGGTLTATAGTSVVTYAGGSVAAGATCNLSVDVESPAAGVFVNTSGALVSTLGTSGVPTDTLTVVLSPLFTKSFAPTAVLDGGISTLTFMIDNTANSVPATGLDFTDAFPAGMTVAPSPNPVDTCTGGTLTATPGAAMITYTGGSVAAVGTCMISLDITISGSGSFVNIADPLNSSLGASPAGGATSTLLSSAIVPTMSNVGAGVLIGLLALLGVAVVRRSLG